MKPGSIRRECIITALLRYMGRHPAHLIYSSLSNGRPFTAAILQLLSINEDGFMCDSFWDESSCGIAFISILVAILAGVLLAGCGGSSGGPVGPVSSSGSFTVCSSTYALCTGSQCTPVADAPGFDACNCRVMTGYSAGQAPCQDVQETGEAQAIFSRYYPITSYTPCSNDRPWANCLDSPCLINNGDPRAATCICTEMKNQGTYILYDSAGKYSPTSCSTGLYSLATVEGADEITEYLQTHNTPLKAPPIKVY